uniref:Ml domain-containing protein n=1 Tax=Strongyloides papillosus TaxID=174720 RepID=A0A0N5CIQ6_STREA
MAFYKALTVFIVCISIFRVIISKSTTVGNKNNSTDYNVSFDVHLKCEPCGGKEVTILLYDKHEEIYDYYANCTKNWFTVFITKYFESPTKEDFNASFFYFCGEKKKEVLKRPAKYIEKFGGVSYYTFGYINFVKTIERKNYKRRNGFRKYKF